MSQCTLLFNVPDMHSFSQLTLLSWQSYVYQSGLCEQEEGQMSTSFEIIDNLTWNIEGTQ